MGARAAGILLREVLAVIEPYSALPNVASADDLWAHLTDADPQRRSEPDQRFWDRPDPLPRLVVTHFGAGPSGTNYQGARHGIKTRNQITSNTVRCHRSPLFFGI